MKLGLHHRNRKSALVRQLLSKTYEYKLCAQLVLLSEGRGRARGQPYMYSIPLLAVASLLSRTLKLAQHKL